MTSLETRDVVKRYELGHNALLQSLLPGGLLGSLAVKERCEALLVPRQVSLEVAEIAAYLTATLRQPPQTSASGARAAPPISALFGEDVDTPERPGVAAQVPAAAAATTGGVTFPPENADAVRAALTRFVEYHLLHFDGFGNSEFTNLRGQRGSFAEDLDHVKRFGHVGQVAVLADADALRPKTSTPPAAAGGTSVVSYYYPVSLQIFIIDRPLMDATELRFIADTLRKLTAPTVSSSDGQKSASPPGTKMAAIPFLMGARDASHVTARVRPTTTTTAQCGASAESPAAAATSAAGDGKDTFSGDESVAETIVIEDFEDEPPEDPDLEAYVTKYTRISERQRQHNESSGTAAAPANHVGGPGAVQGQVAGTRTPPLPGAATAGYVAARVNPAPPVGEGRPSGAAASPLPEQKHPQQGPAAVAARPQLVSATPSAKVAAAPALSTAKAHANVLRHEYSRECIKDYRRVVAADNEIFYSEFERLMSLRCAGPLAKVLSEYVSKNQQLQQPILNNVKYNHFVEKCHALLRQTHRLSADAERLTIMQEGVERYVTSRLYHQIFNSSDADKRANEQLQRKLLRLENMSAARLDALPEVERHHVWGQAMFELDGMDFFKSPREKLRCGMRACELLSLAVGDILRQRRTARQAGGKGTTSLPSGGVTLAFGADEFLPCFLLLVLRARPLSFVQNISYMEKFRFPTLMSAEESYCFATLQSSLLFWQTCSDDGQMPPAGAAAAAASSSGAAPPPPHRGGSVSLRALTTSSSTSRSGPLQQPPLMTEKDLLPSVRQTSWTGRQQQQESAAPDAGRSAATSLPDGSTVVEEEAPTVLDVLFGWANRNLAPLASEIGLGGNSDGAAHGVGNSDTKRRSGSTGGGGTPSVPVAAVAQRSPPRGTVVSSKTTVPQAEVVREGNASGKLFHAASALNFPAAPRLDGVVTSRAHVRELLVTQHKTFEELTLTELKMVVEEARQLLLEGA
ncbi:Vacuolar sorting protein 9 (VPS9) domain containing protein [Novymonas esmeraldas]|uniref:Vacuolar sorting protein 9 (VPS9) domain containing protein n=1 Tax=Novymonas esmeraldas TaxID=1808958 RepID=A0AAW0F348_9TRYP